MDSETFYCAYCFEPNSIFIDFSGGSQQRYVEDCQVCCRPNILYVSWDDFAQCFRVESDCES